MTGLVRKATLLGVCGLFIAASAAFAFVPDPAQSTVPNTIYVVTTFASGPNGVDVDGANGIPNPGVGTANVIVIRDFAMNPISGVGVHIKVPCDINLCTVSPGAPYTTTYSQTVTCDATGNTLHAVTDAAGRVEFVALGGAKSLGAGSGGGGFGSTVVTVDGYAGNFKLISASATNQNGASDGSALNALDASVCLGVFLNGGALWGSNQKARADLDANGLVNALDASFELGHFFRVGSASSAGCTGNYCAKNPCP